MANLVVVDNINHLNTKIDPDKAELHGAELHLVPVVLSEFCHAALQYPIVLTKNGDTGRFVFAAMLGFEAGENLFWQDDSWQGVYLPLQIRRQPFFVEKRVDVNGEASTEKSAEASAKESVEANDEYIVCMDPDSPAICADNTSEKSLNGLALFDENGEDTEYFQLAKTCLRQLLAGEEENELLLSQLKQMDLLQTMTLDITFANQQTTQLKGLYTIDQPKLAKLSDEQILTLHKAGLLAAVYAMTASLGQIHALIDLKNKQSG